MVQRLPYTKVIVDDTAHGPAMFLVHETLADTIKRRMKEKLELTDSDFNPGHTPVMIMRPTSGKITYEISIDTQKAQELAQKNPDVHIPPVRSNKGPRGPQI